MSALRRAFSLASFLILVAGAARGQGDGLDRLAADPMPAVGPRVRLAHLFERRGTLYRGGTKIADPQDRSFREHRLLLTYDHGLTDDLALTVLVPFVGKELSTSGAGGPDTAASFGPGDVALLGRWRFWRWEQRGASLELRAVAGIETPTGRTSAADDGATLPLPLQPGSGSWDPFLALAGDARYDRLELGGELLRKWNGSGAGDAALGDSWTLAARAGWSWWRTRTGGRAHRVELGMAWTRRAAGRGAFGALGSGRSTELALRPALRFEPAPGVELALSVDVPLDQHHQGEQLGLDLRSFVSFAVGF